jgi:hypothetical protein
MTAHLEGDEKTAAADSLRSMSLDTLQVLTPLTPKPKEGTTTNYAGAVGAAPPQGKAEKDFAPFGLPGDYIKEDE